MRLRRLLVVAVVIGLGAVLTAQAPPRPTPVVDRELGRQGAARSARVPGDWSGHAVGPHRRLRGARKRSDHVLRGDGDRRRLQDHQRRHDVHERVRQRGQLGSIGDIAIAPTDANLVWVGTGENNNRQSTSWGDGDLQVDRRRPHVEEHGPSRPASRSRASSSIRWTSTSSTSRRSAICGPPAASAASTRRPTAARPGSAMLNVDDDTGATELVMDPGEQQDALRRDLSAPPRRSGA